MGKGARDTIADYANVGGALPLGACRRGAGCAGFDLPSYADSGDSHTNSRTVSERGNEGVARCAGRLAGTASLHGISRGRGAAVAGVSASTGRAPQVETETLYAVQNLTGQARLGGYGLRIAPGLGRVLK